MEGLPADEWAGNWFSDTPSLAAHPRSTVREPPGRTAFGKSRRQGRRNAGIRAEPAARERGRSVIAACAAAARRHGVTARTFDRL